MSHDDDDDWGSYPTHDIDKYFATYKKEKSKNQNKSTSLRASIPSPAFINVGEKGREASSNDEQKQSSGIMSSFGNVLSGFGKCAARNASNIKEYCTTSDSQRSSVGGNKKPGNENGGKRTRDKQCAEGSIIEQSSRKMHKQDNVLCFRDIFPTVPPSLHRMPSTNRPIHVRMRGNMSQVTAVDNWLRSIVTKKPHTPRALFLEGPSGSGKTTIISQSCEKHGIVAHYFDYMTIGSWADVGKMIDKMHGIRTLEGNYKCLVFDNVDITTTFGNTVKNVAHMDEDEGNQITAKAKKCSMNTPLGIAKTIRSYTNTQSNPIVFISSSGKSSKQVRDIASACVNVRTNPVQIGDAVKIAKDWLKSRGIIGISDMRCTEIASESFGDIRKLVNELEWETCYQDTMTNNPKLGTSSCDVLMTPASRSIVGSTNFVFSSFGNARANIPKIVTLFAIDDKLGSMIHQNYIRSIPHDQIIRSKRMCCALLKGQTLSNNMRRFGCFEYTNLSRAMQGWVVSTYRSKVMNDCKYGCDIIGLNISVIHGAKKVASIQSMLDVCVADTEEFWCMIDLLNSLSMDMMLEWPEEWDDKEIRSFILPRDD